MFDATEAFAKQFVPQDGGYLFYPGRLAGGKLVSEPEYQDLLARWQSVAGRKGTWKTIVAVMAIIVLGTVAKALLNVGDWAENASIGAAVAFVVIRITWASLAPRRLVRGRPDAAPPRSLTESKRLARSMLPWRMVIPVFLVSVAIFINGLVATPQTFVDWLWVVGSGAMGTAYGWIAIKKFGD